MLLLDHPICSHCLALPFLALLSLFVCKYLLFRLVKITAERYNRVEKIVRLHVALFTEVFKETTKLDLGFLDSVSKAGDVLDSTQSKHANRRGS